MFSALAIDGTAGAIANGQAKRPFSELHINLENMDEAIQRLGYTLAKFEAMAEMKKCFGKAQRTG